MAHERSETVGGPSSFWNVFGPGTIAPGMLLPPRYAFEQPVYPHLQEALGASIVRSLLQGMTPPVPPNYVPPGLKGKMLGFPFGFPYEQGLR